MGAEPGRRFLKQPAAKLEPEIVGPFRNHSTVNMVFAKYSLLYFG